MRCRVALSTFTVSGHTLSTEGDDVWEQLYKTLAFQDVGHLWNYSRDTTLEQAKEGAAHLLWRLVASNEKPHGMSDGRVSPTSKRQIGGRRFKVLALLFSWNLLGSSSRP
jgi:hypothetical protein